MMEVNFQRGGNLPVKKVKKPHENDFGERNLENEKPKQKQISKRDRIKKAKAENAENGTKEIHSAKPLSLNTLASDMLVMGIVKAAYSTHLYISLPGRLVGKVPITNISRSYSNLLTTVLENQDLVTKPKTLPELFTIGQVVYTKVLDKCYGEKEEILLSLLPEDINSEVGGGALAEGNVLMCAVEDEEDHGFIMESGVKSFKAFLPKKNVKSTPNIGELMFCKIVKISSNAVTLSAFKKNEMVKIETIDVPNMKTMMPGCVINFSIARILKNGLEGLIFDGSISAYVNEMYLPTKISISDSQIIGKEVKARVLYTMPLSNQLFVSLLIDDPGKPKDLIHFGTLIETAKVIKQTSGGILMKLNGNDRGFLPRRSIVKNLKNNFDIDSALIKYSPNSTHVVRVMDFNAFENCYLCTNDAKLLHEKFFSTYDLAIGQIVQAKVEEKLNDGFRLTIGSVRGFLKGVFLNRSPKIVVGEGIKVRVAEINHDAKFVQVTNQQGLLKDTAKVLSAKRQVKVRESYTGIVMTETDKCYTVLFFNHIKGQLPKTPETEADIISLGGALKVGSVKSFEVRNVKGDRITLKIPKKLDTSNLGKIFECKVSAVLPSGLQVFINDLKVYGKVPTGFLSEFPSLSAQMHANIKEGDKFEVVALVNNLFSRRDVEYYRKGAITDFNDINPGDVLRCFVKSTDADSIELECPLRNFNDSIKLNRNAFDSIEDVILNTDDICYVSVIAKTESHHNTLYVTPSLHKVWKNEMDLPLGMVESFIADNKFLLSKSKKLGRFSVGQRITGTVKNIIGNNLLLEIEDGIFAQGTVDNVQSYKIGGTVKDSVIVWLDPVLSMIHVTLKEKCKEEISVDQKIDVKMVNEKKHKAIVVFFNDYVTVCTIRKSGQPLVYAPSKFHYNDFSPMTHRALGNATSKLVIKRAFEGNLLSAFVQDYKIFQKVEKCKTKLGKRKIDEKVNVTTGEDVKKPKVILDDSDDEEAKDEIDEERNTETEDSENEISVTKPAKKSNKSFKNTLKRTFSKSAPKVSMRKKNFANKDSLLNENIVNLVSYKSIKDNESNPAKKPLKVLKKSTIGKKLKPKRLGKKK